MSKTTLVAFVTLLLAFAAIAAIQLINAPQEKSCATSMVLVGQLNPETGEVAPDGQMWCQNLLSRKWFLQSDRTPYTCSPASETYWCS